MLKKMPNKIIIHPWNAAFDIFAFLFDCYVHDFMPYILHDDIIKKKIACSNDDRLDKIVHVGQ
jgi:hypothetical protein